jgi:hypothetical protein
MTTSSPAITSQVRDHAKVMEPYTCRSTSNSAFFDADERPSRTSHPQTRMKMR